MDIHIDGLETYGYHGVLPEEKVLGQQFLFDLRLSMAECRGATSDDVADTVDYTEVIDAVTEVATCTSYDLLEKLAGSVAEALLARFPVDSVSVRVTKPHPPIPCSVRGVGVSLEMNRGAAAADSSAAGGGACRPAAPSGPATQDI